MVRPVSGPHPIHGQKKGPAHARGAFLKIRLAVDPTYFLRGVPFLLDVVDAAAVTVTDAGPAYADAPPEFTARTV